MKTTSKATKYVTDPLTWVAKKTMRQLPFWWGNEDIWDLTHDHFALELYQDELRSSITKTVSALKNGKVPAAKVTMIKESLNLVLASLDHESSLEHGTSHVPDMLAALSKASKTTVANEYVDGKWKAKKKLALTGIQYKLLQENITRMKTELKAASKGNMLTIL